MYKKFIACIATFASLFYCFTTPINARQIKFGSGKDTVIFSTLSYTTYGGSYQHYWIIKNGKSCHINWRWTMKICDEPITNETNDQWNINAYKPLPNATPAERQLLRFLQTAQPNQILSRNFSLYHQNNQKTHFVKMPGSNKVVCTKNEPILGFSVTSTDAPTGYLKTEVCYGKVAYFRLKDLDMSYQSIPAFLKSNTIVYDNPSLSGNSKKLSIQNANLRVGLHPINFGGVWRVVAIYDDSQGYHQIVKYDSAVLSRESISQNKNLSPTYVSESQIIWISD
ncbi:hypothetical protein NON20_25565 (plasmid) [Synechocystis sp. B12]|nr:hypothetical protein NON20_25565 [Synechocystis sp. B12]